MASKEKLNAVLFVCLGNICRSPIAEAIFRKEVDTRGLAKEQRWIIDSAAIGPYHIGKTVDPRTHWVLGEQGLTTDHIVRQITVDDFHHFDLILGMDHDNLADLTRMKPKGCRAAVRLLGDFYPVKPIIIEDPYRGTDEDFETVYEQCKICCVSLLDDWHP